MPSKKTKAAAKKAPVKKIIAKRAAAKQIVAKKAPNASLKKEEGENVVLQTVKVLTAEGLKRRKQAEKKSKIK